SDAHELDRMESALERWQTPGEEVISLARLLPGDASDLALPAKTRNSAIPHMPPLAPQTGWLWDPGTLADAVLEREGVHATALENGVALLHPRRPQAKILAESFLALGRVERGIPFGGSRGVLTDTFFLICAMDDRTHLRVLARLSRMLQDE